MTYARLGKLREYKGAAVIFAGTMLAALALSLIWVGTASADHVCQLNPNPSFSVNERGSVSLSAGSTECTSVNWDLDNDGAYDDGSGTTITFEAGDRDGPGSQIVGLEGHTLVRVCDPEIHACMFEDDFAYAQTTVNIVNAPPTATGINTSPLTINEGSTFSFSLAGVSDVSAEMANLQYLLACRNDTFSSSTTNNKACSTTDSGFFMVRGQVRDKDGDQSTVYIRSVPINNVAPTATPNVPRSAATGTNFAVSLTNPSDPSSEDTTQGFTYAFDCTGDGVFEHSGTTNSANCTAGNGPSQTVMLRITDKDGGSSVQSRTVRILPLLTITDRRVTEGESGSKSAVFTVRLSSASQQRVTVNYATANGTAKAPGDYTARSGTLSFAPTETAKTMSVAVKGDRLNERNETFFVRLSGAVNAAIVDASGQGTIIDND